MICIVELFERSRFLILIELGLFFGMCADVLLGVQFILGILFFALGHVFYLIAFYTLEKFHWKDICIIFSIAVIIACMLGKASSNLSLNKNISRKLIFLGSAMFWFSDVMLAIDIFGEGGRITWILCSYTYWPAQNILAFSLFHLINEQLV